MVQLSDLSAVCSKINIFIQGLPSPTLQILLSGTQILLETDGNKL